MTTCQNPTCNRDASEAYRDENGNSVDVCERHYYQLVTGRSVGTATLSPAVKAQASVPATPTGEAIGGARRELGRGQGLHQDLDSLAVNNDSFG